MVVKIFFDGACMTGGQTDQETGIGVAVYIDNEYSDIFSRKVLGDLGSNNIAEWCGCVNALEIAKEIVDYCETIPNLIIYSDSQLIVKQFNGEFEIKHQTFVKYFTKAKKLANEIGYKKLIWIPREQNRQADRLSKMALGKPTTKKDILFLE